MLFADKYNVKGLFRISRETLMEILDFEKIQETKKHIVKTVILGDKLDDKSLMDAAMKNMVERKLSLEDLNDWETLKKYPELLSNMFQYHGSAMVKKLSNRQNNS